ncbi:uncharacterized protein LOC120499008 isoform X7 [Passer montanus]|uniref:uncharacterized protein LOC120499008 isoform X7 n=1 Tax=Passer montanus TaxID=9160 RepID=UPI001960534A|nr:uncharacterized protein LOC120499008 isoform X7 [Passer montanus]
MRGRTPTSPRSSPVPHQERERSLGKAPNPRNPGGSSPGAALGWDSLPWHPGKALWGLLRPQSCGVAGMPAPRSQLDGIQLFLLGWDRDFLGMAETETLSVTAPPGPPRARGSDKDVSAALPPPGPGTRPSTPNFEAIPQLQQAGRGDSSSVPPQGTPLKCHQTFQCHKSQDKPQQGHPQNPLPNTEPCIKLRLREKNVKKMKTEINKIDERREKAARRRGSVAVCYANRGGLRAGGRAGEV